MKSHLKSFTSKLKMKHQKKSRNTEAMGNIFFRKFLIEFSHFSTALCVKFWHFWSDEFSHLCTTFYFTTKVMRWESRGDSEKNVSWIHFPLRCSHTGFSLWPWCPHFEAWKGKNSVVYYHRAWSHVPNISEIFFTQ